MLTTGKSTGRESFTVPDIAFFAIIFSVVWLLHISLLQVPYFWDEAGYYVPAARDLWRNGQLIPASTLSSGHPPLVLAWLAFWWKFSKFTPTVTRTAMLLVSAFGLLGVFRLARQVANSSVAITATALTAIYPVWFAQSSMAHLDLAAAALTVWAVGAYLGDRRCLSVSLFALAGIAKETAIVAPVALCAYELIVTHLPGRRRSEGLSTIFSLPFPSTNWLRSLSLIASGLPLLAWFLYHHARTGVFFGNPEFFRYNVAATAHPVRVALALMQRLWHAFGYLNLFVLVAAAGMAMLYSPVSDNDEERERIAIPVQVVFGVLVASYVVMLSLLGGAVLARYMLPVVPLVVIVCVSTLRRRIRAWIWVCAAVGATFVLALFTVPPYRISPEDNLSYVDFVRSHQLAARVLQSRFPNARILTAWPASDELTRPWLGYVNKPAEVVRIENFSLQQIEAAAQNGEQYEVAYLFSTKLEPPTPMFAAPFWTRLQERFFDYHRDIPPEAAATILGGRVVYELRRGSEWVAIVAIERAQNARLDVAE